MMRVWLLQSRRGGRTCGHFHVRESGRLAVPGPPGRAGRLVGGFNVAL